MQFRPSTPREIAVPRPIATPTFLSRGPGVNLRSPFPFVHISSSCPRTRTGRPLRRCVRSSRWIMGFVPGHFRFDISLGFILIAPLFCVQSILMADVAVEICAGPKLRTSLANGRPKRKLLGNVGKLLSNYLSISRLQTGCSSKWNGHKQQFVIH